MGTTSPLPDLSLQISPPSIISDLEVKEVGCDGFTKKSFYSDGSSATDSGSSGSDLSHENGFFSTESGFPFGPGEPMLSLGLEMAALNPPPLELPRNFHHSHHNHQPQIYGREFKRNSRMTNGSKRSIRAPRMRWTTTLHAHFVHAVQLLGGHESMSKTNSRWFSCLYVHPILILSYFLLEMQIKAEMYWYIMA